MNNHELEESVSDVLSGLAEKEQLVKQKIEEIKDKQLEIKEFNTEVSYKRMQAQKKMQQSARSADFNFDYDRYVQETVESNTQYLDSAREKSMNFINHNFDKVVPFMPNNVILIGARTGKGKSTSTANIAYRCLLDGKRVLVLSNEERRADVYNRVTALLLGKNYADHKNLKPEDRDLYNEYIVKLSKRMMVIDDAHTNSTGGMSVLETVVGYLDAASDSDKFDVILIDYAQKVNMSSEIPTAGTWEIQEKFYYHIENTAKKKGCPPIVLMAQLKPDSKDGIAYEERFEGRRTIVKPATCIMEAAPDYDAHATNFVVHKTRWSESNGKTVRVGFLKGKYVEYDDEFRQYVERTKQEELIRKAGRNELGYVRPGNTV